MSLCLMGRSVLEWYQISTQCRARDGAGICESFLTSKLSLDDEIEIDRRMRRVSSSDTDGADTDGSDETNYTGDVTEPEVTLTKSPTLPAAHGRTSSSSPRFPVAILC